MEIIWIVLVLQAFICGILASNVAKHKGHSPGTWFASGFVFGIFGLIAAAGLPIKPSISSTSFTKKCSDCAEDIRKEALVCKFCGKQFSKEQVVDELLESLRDTSLSNKLRALNAFHTISDSHVISNLVKFIDTLPISNSEDPQIELLNKAAQVVLETGRSAISPELVSILKKTGSSIKADKLLEMLGSFRDASSIPAIIDSMQKPELRTTAAQQLQKFGEAALPHLDELIKSGKRANRKLAEQILAKIKSISRM